MFNGILISKTDVGGVAEVRAIDEADLPEGDVTIQVAYSSLNYKDALAITGASPVVRKFPMVPGIDLAGTVTHSVHPRWQPGDQVILNGWGVGESHWGGLAEQARVRGDWLVPLPAGLSLQQAMAIGTAGYTAMLCVMAIERQGVQPGAGEVVVTGAAGGVGSVAVALLAKLGHQVTALTGRPQEEAYLRRLGATQVVPRQPWSEPGKPLAKERWVAAVDTVGGQVLANVCAAMRYEGVVTACGLAGGMAWPASVAPFILRGVSLLGIDSVMCPLPRRSLAWSRLATDLDLSLLGSMTQEVPLSEAVAMAPALLEGKVRGRIVVRVAR